MKAKAPLYFGIPRVLVIAKDSNSSVVNRVFFILRFSIAMNCAKSQ
jgi:hypothetical protein